MILQAEDLVRSYGEVQALAGLSFELEEGTITGLVGPDGAGKTTTMRLLTGLMRPDSGVIRHRGQDVTGRRATGGWLGYMPQRFSLYGDLTVDENLRFYAELFGVRGDRRKAGTERLLGFARLTEFRRRRAAALSGGMKQKLALACTLIHEPEVLLLDEPTTGVDPVSRIEFWEILGSLRDAGTALLISTPYMDEADRCDRVLMLREGVVMDEGTPGELRSRFPRTILEISAQPLAGATRALEALEGIREVVPFGTRLHVTVDDPEAAAAEVRRALAQRDIRLDSVSPTPPSLEDVFVALAGER
jgi:ABC-2 type transport system ATP-binding protein